MKRFSYLITIGICAAVLGGCATTTLPASDDATQPVAQQAPSNMPADPYGRRGVNLGIGIGSWGGRAGGGIGVGYGW
ncbi:MAG TPA: hypothetical protein VGU61_12355 [Noviherbaspirillum sp.]|jgi:hypothetical protein|uniref:hypothetical protein n=1 Tax=Noviherbaspirillum sp. TaxID=1926288 RepID=UPI002DDD2869|nr:hypothetical protein [Noviherbaspirillum sp.]HEV2611052.1 hypothetical protein [Noviherbaspirillum sp.]